MTTRLYRTPPECYCPLHHVRPRFKDDLEGVLLHFADAVVQTRAADKTTFDRQLNARLREYPGNATKSEKTMSNWRTEIAALFTFVQHGPTGESPSRRCRELSERRDLPEAFRKFLFSFQYPGGHLRPDYAAELIQGNVRFKPAQTILRVFRAGNGNDGNSFCLTKSEVCHCIFNDLRVTRDHEDAHATLRRILDNRRNGLTYVEDGDVVRYAGDILDYMAIAGLLKTYDGKTFYVNAASNSVISHFLLSEGYFDGYDGLYGKSVVTAASVAERQPAWERFVNRELPATHFGLDVAELLAKGSEAAEALHRIDALGHADGPGDGDGTKGLSSHDLGERGEAIVYGHECMRLKSDGREDLVHLVKRIPSSFAMGFDISSIESETEQKRYIEVKSTESFKPIQFNSVHLTPNEWRVAETERGRYFVYRLFISISTGETRLYLLQDPVGKYKADEVTMTPSSSGGVDIRFDCKKVGKFEELLKWSD